MSSANQYRNNAQDCLRWAKAASDERDRPLWVTMAQSWLRLAEHADRVNHEVGSEASSFDGDQEVAEATSAAN